MVDECFTASLGKIAHHEINARILSDVLANQDEPSWATKMVAEALVMHLHNAFL